MADDELPAAVSAVFAEAGVEGPVAEARAAGLSVAKFYNTLRGEKVPAAVCRELTVVWLSAASGGWWEPDE